FLFIKSVFITLRCGLQGGGIHKNRNEFFMVKQKEVWEKMGGDFYCIYENTSSTLNFIDYLLVFLLYFFY
ncbi:hypothetical protein, partial [Treponema sp.]|uniref:hypothetical protein n=1 Tax=Treponema sp. TaxID=166 RepID=UPI003F0FC58B